MPRSFVSLVIVAMMFLFTGTAYGETVTLDGSEVSPVFLRDGHLLVPFRALMKRLGATVTWASPRASATLNGQQLVTVNMGDSNALVKGNPTYMTVPPQLIGGNPYVAVDALSNICGAKVTYSANRDSATVTGCTLQSIGATGAAPSSRDIWLWVLAAIAVLGGLWILLGTRSKRPAATTAVSPREIPNDEPHGVRGAIDRYAANVQRACEGMDDARRASFVEQLSQSVNERRDSLPESFLMSAKVARDNAASGSAQAVSALIVRFSDRPELLRDAVKKFNALHPNELVRT